MQMTDARRQLLDRILPLGVALVLLAGAGLAARVGLQLQGLASLHTEIAYREGLARDYGARGAAPVGAALLAAPLASLSPEVAARIRRQADAAGIKVSDLEVVSRKPGGPNLQLVRLTLRGTAEAQAVDRFVRWIDRNAASVAVERLAMATPQGASPSAEVAIDIAVLAAATGAAS
jgi:hypothetical protein